jgi:hypothetical protein
MRIKPEFFPRPLDYNEHLCWEISLYSRGGMTINFFTLFAGDVDPDVARRAWTYLCLRHPMLGATIEAGNDRSRFVPLQHFPEIEVLNTSSEDLIEHGLRIAHPTAFGPGCPLFRSFVIRNVELRRHVFLLVAEHAAVDGAACLTLHKDFAQALNEPDLSCSSTQQKSLPPSLHSLLLAGPKRARFFVNGALDFIRYNLLPETIPFEQPAPIEQRSTGRLIALLDSPSTQLILDQASHEYGLTSYLAARFLRAGYLHLRERGLCRSNARPGLYIPVDLRPYFGASMHKNVSMSTILQSANLRIDANQDNREIAGTIQRKKEHMVRRKSIMRDVLNWYSPAMSRKSVIATLKRNRLIAGVGATHIGRLNSAAAGKIKILASHGYSEVRHGMSLMGGTTQIIRKRLLVTMTYCAPAVRETTARQIFEQFLVIIGANANCLIVQNYDDALTELLNPDM